MAKKSQHPNALLKIAPMVYWKCGAFHHVRRPPGQRKQVWTRLGKTPAEALAALARMREGDDARSTMLPLFEHYERHELNVTPAEADASARKGIPRRVKAASTVAAQTSQLVALKGAMGHMPREDVTPFVVAELHDALAEARGHVMANRMLSLLSDVCRFGIRKGYLDANPCANIEKHPEAPRQRYVTDAEFALLSRFAAPWLRLAMDLARTVGQRESALLKLRLTEIRDDGWHFPAMKGGKAVIVQWTPALRSIYARGQVIRAMIEDDHPGRVLAPNFLVSPKTAGGALTVSGLQSAMRLLKAKYLKHCRDEGIEPMPHWTFHDLRAKAASDGDDDNLLGHQNPATKRRVYDRKPKMVRAAR